MTATAGKLNEKPPEPNATGLGVRLCGLYTRRERSAGRAPYHSCANDAADGHGNRVIQSRRNVKSIRLVVGTCRVKLKLKMDYHINDANEDDDDESTRQQAHHPAATVCSRRASIALWSLSKSRIPANGFQLLMSPPYPDSVILLHVICTHTPVTAV